MTRYDYRCLNCMEMVEVVKPMAQNARQEPCPKCGKPMQRVYEFPHTELNWKAYDRNDTGSDRMVIGAAHPGKIVPMDDRAQKYNVVVHDDPRQSGQYN